MACALVAGFALTSCDSDRLTPTGDTTKLWIAGEDDSNLLGYINGSGKMVIPANYQTAYNFSCGWALVKEDGEVMYIDANGKPAKNLPEADWPSRTGSATKPSRSPTTTRTSSPPGSRTWQSSSARQ